jgi:hypothetical protein
MIRGVTFVAGALVLSPLVSACGYPDSAYAGVAGARARAERADVAVRAAEHAREHERRFRELWGIETETVAAPMHARRADIGTANEFGTWDH